MMSQDACTELERPAYTCPLGGREMHKFVSRCYQQLTPDPQPSQNFFQLMPGFLAFRLLSIFLRRAESRPISPIASNLCDSVLEHWPDIWKWLKCANIACRNPRKCLYFLNDHDHCALFSSIAMFIRDCCLHEHPLHQKVRSTTIGIVVDLWYYQLRRPHRYLDPGSCTLQVLADWSYRKTAAEGCDNGPPLVINRIGRPVEEIASVMLRFLEYHISSTTTDSEPIVCHVRFMAHLSTYSNFRNALMTVHSMHIVTRALVHLSYKMMSSPELNSNHCRRVRDALFMYLLHTFLDMEGIVPIRRCMEAGLLLAVLRGGACDRGDDGEQLALLVSSICPYLVYLSILRAASRSLAKVDLVRMEERMDRQGKFWQSWILLKAILLDRFLLLPSGIPKRCDNNECGRMDFNANFKRCGGCQDMRYCSPRCQRLDWLVNGHRQHCMVVRRYVREGQAVECSLDDLAFVKYLAVEDFQAFDKHKHPTSPQIKINYMGGFPVLEPGDSDGNKRTGLWAVLPWGSRSRAINVNHPVDTRL